MERTWSASRLLHHKVARPLKMLLLQQPIICFFRQNGKLGVSFCDTENETAQEPFSKNEVVAQLDVTLVTSISGGSKLPLTPKMVKLTHSFNGTTENLSLSNWHLPWDGFYKVGFAGFKTEGPVSIFLNDELLPLHRKKLLRSTGFTFEARCDKAPQLMNKLVEEHIYNNYNNFRKYQPGFQTQSCSLTCDPCVLFITGYDGDQDD